VIWDTVRPTIFCLQPSFGWITNGCLDTLQSSRHPHSPNSGGASAYQNFKVAPFCGECRVALNYVYIKSCSHEVAKHKSGVIYRFHMTVPPLATTRKMVTQSVRMGNAHAGNGNFLPTFLREFTKKSIPFCRENNILPWWYYPLMWGPAIFKKFIPLV
jgi:hypothetical protein